MNVHNSMGLSQHGQLRPSDPQPPFQLGPRRIVGSGQFHEGLPLCLPAASGAEVLPRPQTATSRLVVFPEIEVALPFDGSDLEAASHSHGCG